MNTNASPKQPKRARWALLSLAAAGSLAATAALAQQRPGADNRDGLLTEEQVNRIRQVELQPADLGNPPRIRFEERAVQRFVESRPEINFRAFNAEPDVTKALYMVDAAADPEVLSDVVIATDPGSLAAFKQNVHTAVLQGCATSACHGSPDPSKHGGFRLYNEGRDDATVYTNFYTIVRTGVDVPNPTGGAFGGPESVRRLLVDRQNADASLLLSYGLPANASPTPHPQVDGFRPMWNNPNEPTFQFIRGWIGQGLEKGAGRYGFANEPAELPNEQAQQGVQVEQTPQGTGQSNPQ